MRSSWENLDKESTGNLLSQAIDSLIFLLMSNYDCRVGIQLPKVEVRFESLTVEANCYIGSRALPSLGNAAKNSVEWVLDMIGISFSKRTKLKILKDASGILKPSRYIFYYY